MAKDDKVQGVDIKVAPQTTELAKGTGDTLETLSVKVAALRDDVNSLERISRQAWDRLTKAQSGTVEETEHYCTDCGEPVDPMGHCEAHPHAKVNHGGTDPRTGKPVTLRTT